MHKQLKLIDDLKAELARIDQLRNRLENDLRNVPKGSLMRRRNGKLYYVISEKGVKKQCALNIEKQQDREMINKLKYKKYIKEALPILDDWCMAIKCMLRKVEVYDPVQIEKQLKIQYKGLKDMNVFLEGDVNPDEWEMKEHPGMYDDGKIYPSEGGLMTRSKSEAMIASKYEKMGWMFEYEPVLITGEGKTLRPDFKIIHPVKRKIIYHEHFGLMDDPEYTLKTVKKLEDYADMGISLGDNLVITTETKRQPLTYKTIDETIRKIQKM